MRTAQPELGIYTASEIDGRERVAGVAISIPIPGGVRDSRSARAVAAIEVSRQEVELKQRQHCQRRRHWATMNEQREARPC